MDTKDHPADLPTGTVTILFTDIEGSTRLLQQLGVADYSDVLAQHHRLIRAAVAAATGVEIKTEGDSFFVVFRSASDAVRAAAQAQRDLNAAPWPADSRVSVRMGVHTGDVGTRDGDYVGLDVHRAARISAAAHGGQVLVSGTTAALVGSTLPAGVSLADLGDHRLKDIDNPEHLFQLNIYGLPTDFPPPRALTARYELLPAEVSSFIGREAELARARELLAGTRLLTLTGPGGTGKTRLSLRLARAAIDEFEDGAAFVPLASISDPRLVPTTIRIALGLQEQSGRTATETLIDRLSGRELLLVLDNFEQVAAGATTVAELLAALPGLTMVVTSRVPLHVSGEQEYAVPPLAVPEAVAAADLDMLSANDAVSLFTQRARAVRSDFALTAENAAAVVAICARLDGLPLAIELAASRVKLLPPAALLERLGRTLDLLQSTAADRTDRQRTLRGAIDWSYGLLGEPERTLFRRLSIFVGGFRLEDGEAVTGAAGPVGVDVLDGVGMLVDNSLVRELGELPEIRFGMLETIREFGRERLVAANELDSVAEAHARQTALLAEASESRLTIGAEWPDRLEANHDNMRAGLAWLSQHDVQQALLMAGRIWRFWHLRGHLREGSTTLAALLAAPGAAERTTNRAKALIGYAGLVYWMTDYATAKAAYEEALSIARETADKQLEVEILYSLAYVRAIEHDYDGAIADFRAAEEMFKGIGNELMATWAFESVAMVVTMRGDHAEAIPMLEDSRARFERLGDTFGLRNALSIELRALMHLGRVAEAGVLTTQLLELSYDQGDMTSFSAALLDAAALAALDGGMERAARLCGAAQRIIDESGGQPPVELVNRINPRPILEQSLPADQLTALVAEGRRLTDDQAMALALAD